MILIADSGATKTDWRVIYSREDIRPLKTNGFNPFFISSIQLRDELDKELVPFIDSRNVKEVFFYGAGCNAVEKCIIIEEGLKPIFPNARITVESDLLGAARALCGHNEGIAGILGTGSNSCFFDGKKITENVPSLGYLLGDEGSGAYIGKRLLKEILSLSAPPDVREMFSKKYNYSKVDILTHLYKMEFPNRFLASFTNFVSENISHSFLQTLVHDAFCVYFDTQILKYQRYKEVAVYLTGSVAFYFSDILKEVARERNIEIKNIIQAPIAGLVEYQLVEFEKFNAIKFTSDLGE